MRSDSWHELVCGSRPFEGEGCQRHTRVGNEVESASRCQPGTLRRSFEILFFFFKKKIVAVSFVRRDISTELRRAYFSSWPKLSFSWSRSACTDRSKSKAATTKFAANMLIFSMVFLKSKERRCSQRLLRRSRDSR